MIHAITYLRAIGIVLIVLGHMEVNWMPGAHLSVDMFFVIAGFLATKIIVSQFENGRVSLSEYYGKRVLRLVPSFLVVATVSSLVAVLLLSPKFLLNYFQSLIFALLQAGNFFFFLNTDYFGPKAIEMPLLHTWALSLEEQFFLTFPLVFIALYRRLSLMALIALCLAAFVLSLGVNQGLMAYRNSLFGNDFLPGGAIRPSVGSMLFYMVIFRSFEFLIGIVGFLLTVKKPDLVPEVAKPHVSVFGYSLALLSWVFIDEGQFSVPGFYHLIPCIGALLIMLGGDNAFYSKIWPKQILSVVGRASYSIYLTHWPVISFSHFLGADFHNAYQVALIFLLCILSGVWLCIKFEEPVRYAGYRDMAGYGKKVALRCLYVALGLIVFGMFVIFMSGHLLVKEDNSYQGGLRNYSSYKTVDDPVLRVAVLGESHAEHVLPLLRAYFNPSRIHVEGYSGSSCVPFPGVGVYNKGIGYLQLREPTELSGVCVRYHDSLVNKVVHDYDAVIFSAGWNRYLSKNSLYELRRRGANGSVLTKDQLTEEVDRSVKLFLENGLQVLIIGQMPETRMDTFDCRNRPVSYLFDCNSRVSAEEQERYSALATDVFSTVAARHKNVIFVNPNPILCPESEALCLSEINGVPLYRDDNHLSAVGSAELAPLFADELGPFKHLLLSSEEGN